MNYSKLKLTSSLLPGYTLFVSIFLFVILISCKKNPGLAPQNGIYVNGILSTGNISNSGVVAPAGTTWSECQPDLSSNTSNWSIGTGCFYNSTHNIWIADDFTIPSGQTWAISKIAVYGLVSNSTTNPFDGLHLQIWDGKPGLSTSSIIYGDANTNFLSQVIDSLIYGIQNSVIPAPGVVPDLTRKFWKLVANVDKTLQAGTYWLAWQTHIFSGLESYAPFIKAKNARSLPSWNAVVAFVSGGGWGPATDPGNPTSAPDLPQDFPFEIVYTY